VRRLEGVCEFQFHQSARAGVGVGETAGIDEFHLQSYTRLYLKAR
jgi:hypothetical protein